MDKWKNKIAVITGASSGIGAAIVDRLLSEGLEVVGLSRSIIPRENTKFHAIQTDITKEEDILQSFKWIENDLGSIHIFINNAGIIRKSGIICGAFEDWRDTFDTNVMGLCIATREAIKNMQKFKVNGHIINISSTAGHTVPNFPNLNVYPASKSAVQAVSETIRYELQAIESKIKVTNISPSTVNTPMAVTGGLTTAEGMSAVASKILQPVDIANSVIFVLSSEPNVEISEIIMRSVDSPF